MIISAKPRRALVMALAATLVCGSASGVMARSAAYCDDYARDFANQNSNAGENIVGGAVAGAIGGALLGGILGGKKKVGKGALIGTGVGTAAGAVNSSAQWQGDYNYAFNRCMSSGSAGNSPRPGSPAWYDYCEAKYRSFDPDTGMYLASSGSWKPCR
ncbi:MAG: BA14K family protein [Aestuariivirgaceae bacterium]